MPEKKPVQKLWIAGTKDVKFLKRKGTYPGPQIVAPDFEIGKAEFPARFKGEIRVEVRGIFSKKNPARKGKRPSPSPSDPEPTKGVYPGALKPRVVAKGSSKLRLNLKKFG